MPKLPLIWPWMLTAALAAQQGSAPDLPRLTKLGPMPTMAMVVQVGADAVVRDGANKPIDLAELVLAVAGPSAPVLLRVDRLAPSAIVASVLEVCADWGAGTVQFAAVLPDGRQGAFTLALPEANDAPTVLDLRLHRQRRGVPPACARPFLVNMLQGWTEAKQPPLVLGVEVPGDAPFEQLLQALAVVADAGIERAVVRSMSATGAGAPGTDAQRAALSAATHDAAQESLAIDLAPGPFVRVPGPAGPGALAVPVLLDGAVGCRGRAPRLEPIRHSFHPDFMVRAQCIESSLLWLAQTQQVDGSWADMLGAGDLEATALALLGILGDWQVLGRGCYNETVGRAVGWLLVQQRDDGSFADSTSIRAQAMATWALIEACGLSADEEAGHRGVLLRAYVQLAITWIERQRQPGGGWSDGRAGAPADTVSTAWCLLALQSARYFGFQLQQPVEAQAAWLDEVTEASGVVRMHVVPVDGDQPLRMQTTAAATCARLFIFQDMDALARAKPTAELLAECSNAEDPVALLFTTGALYQCGGTPWCNWTRRLAARMSDRKRPQQIEKGPGAGSWDPPDGMTRTATTALHLLTLEFYYCYTRLVR